jgi:hypothetical protein
MISLSFSFVDRLHVAALNLAVLCMDTGIAPERSDYIMSV